MTRLQVYSATRGYRHASIHAGVEAVRELASAEGFDVDATEDAAAFRGANLARYAAVVFLNTTGNVLDDDGRSALSGFVAAGGGFVGVHGAADAEYDWPSYEGLVGAWFEGHPEIQPATFVVEDGTHPATGDLPERWSRVEELYNYQTNPRPGVRVLMTLDETSYENGTMGADHPITWCHRGSGGPAFYTGVGHNPESYSEPEVRRVLRGGLRYATGTVRVDDRPEPGFVPAGPPGDVDDWAGPGLDAPSAAVKFAWQTPVEARLGGRPVPLGGADALRAINPVGEWNTTELAVDGGRLVGYLNGLRVLDLDRDGWSGGVSLTGTRLRRILRR